MNKICVGLTVFVLVTMLTAIPGRAGEWFSCNPTEIMEFSNRVHVKCSNTHYAGSESAPGGRMDGLPEIRFIAVSTEHQAKAERFISLATTALACGYTFRVRIPVSGQNNTQGCNRNDCRTPEAFGVQK